MSKSNIEAPMHILSLFLFVQNDLGWVLDGILWESPQEFVDSVLARCFIHNKSSNNNCGVHKFTFSHTFPHPKTEAGSPLSHLQHLDFVPKVLHHNPQLILECIPTWCNDLYLVFNNDGGVLKITFSHTFSSP